MRKTEPKQYVLKTSGWRAFLRVILARHSQGRDEFISAMNIRVAPWVFMSVFLCGAAAFDTLETARALTLQPESWTLWLGLAFNASFAGLMGLVSVRGVKC